MYNYQTEKPYIFTEDGNKIFLKIRDKVHSLLKTSGAFMMENATNGMGGNSWFQLACVDYLVELGEIREIKTDGAAQHRIFVSRWR